MKICPSCGNQIHDEAVFCPRCGCLSDNMEIRPRSKHADVSPLKLVAKIFMIVSTVCMGFALIPLAWMIPMTIKYSKSIRENKPVSTDFKVCALIFVNVIAGVLMLVDED